MESDSLIISPGILWPYARLNSSQSISITTIEMVILDEKVTQSNRAICVEANINGYLIVLSALFQREYWKLREMQAEQMKI